MNRNAIVFCCALLAGCGGKAPVDDTFSDLAGVDDKSDKFTGRITVVGQLEYGMTSKVHLNRAGKWSAITFLGTKGDKLSIDVKSSNGDPVAWLVDKSMEILAYNDDFGGSTNSHIEHTLASGANTTFYVVTRDYYRRSFNFTITVNGQRAGSFDAPCTRDAECALVRPDCCNLQARIGVRADQVDAYRASLGCPRDLICPAVLPIEDNNVALCESNKCVAVAVEDIACGGFSLNPHSCPPGYNCVGDGLARDLPGTCEPASRTCGGIAGLVCPGDQICVDDPNDSCDPDAGGADCGGVCKDAICSGATARCAAGYHWDQFECNCVENTVCGGISGFSCPTGKRCVDNPNDSCDPNNGGNDCGGICVPTSDCRTTGCSAGNYCTFCWVNYACIPVGALC